LSSPKGELWQVTVATNLWSTVLNRSVYPGVAPVHMYIVRSTRMFIFIFFYYHGITRVPVLCIPRPVTVPVFIDEGIF
jgi:hypothetical protein